MSEAPRWRRYLRFWGSDVHADVDEEFRFHMEAEIDELVAVGMSRDAAREAALRRFGDMNHFRRECASADERRLGRERRTEHLNVLGQDLRYALRSLRNNPLFAGIAIATLALGIGANTAIFSVVNGVLLKPLPYREPDQLVTLWETVQDERALISYPNYVDWRQRQRGFEDITVYNPFVAFTMTGSGSAERVRGAMVAGNYFQLLGVRPAVGRLIMPEDDTPTAPPVVVLAHGFFQTRFGGDPSVLGRALVLDEIPRTVIGVLPPEVRVSNREAIVPLGPVVNEPRFSRENHGLFGMGRRKAGVALEQAIADLQRVSAELRAEYPRENAPISSGGQPIMDSTVGSIRPALKMLMIAVGLVLLIACANVANLVLSRSASRQREFALRTALGAARWRIVRQLLTESFVLALAGGALGVAIARGGVKLLLALDPSSVPRLADISVDRTVLFFALGVSVLTGVLFGLVPALQSGRSDPVNALKEGGRGGGTGTSRQRLRATLTVAEVALAVVLLAGAGLLLRSFAKLTAVDPGFDPSNVLAGRVAFGARYASNAQRQAAFDELLTRVRALPGVQHATVATDLPVETTWQTGVRFEALPPPDPSQPMMLNAAVVDPSYFQTLDIPLVSGRQLSAADREGQPRVILVSEAVARRFFPRGDVLGQRMNQGDGSDSTRWFTIVGVVKDTRTNGLVQQPRGTFYMARAQEEMRAGWLMVRSNLPAEQITASLRRALEEVDPNVPLSLVSTMEATIGEIVAEPRFSMLLLTIFAGVAILLASVGIYGVISYNVTQRSSEIGVRVALGAQRGDVLALVVGQAMAMAAVGVVIGIVLALWGSKMLHSMLFGVGPRDPLVLAVVAVFLLLVALAAATAPALRAARIDPTVAIRSAALLFLLVPGEARAQRASAPRVEGVWQRVACPFDTTKALLPVRCGRLKVPENYWEPQGRSVEVAVMVVSAPARIDSNPVIFLNGGPGSTSVLHAERLVATPAIRDVVVDRDWVFFDHRGAGRSMPSLYCPPGDDWFKRVASCRDQFLKDGVNLRQYNSIEISRDMEALRKALGVKQWNVWGASYGSRLAFTYARYYPGAARTVLIDGPYLPEDQERVDDLRGAEIVFNRIMTKCAADEACAARYPELRRRFYAALPRLRQQPLTTGGERIGDYRVVNFPLSALYGGSGLTFEQSIQSVLAYMDAAARGDGARILEIERQVARPARPPLPVEARSSMGLNLSLDCREEKAFESLEEYAQAAATSEVIRSFFPRSGYSESLATCATWPSGRADPIENSRVYYDGPILAFTGELDPTLSGITGFKIEMLYANARHVVFRNAGHVQFYIRIDDYSPEEYVYRKCALELARQFLSDPKRRLDTRCAESRQVRLVPDPLPLNFSRGTIRDRGPLPLYPP